MANQNNSDFTENIINLLVSTKDNKELVEKLKRI
jgi:hypothetical protein